MPPLKLFMIVYIFGQVAEVHGPLPGIRECNRRAVQQYALLPNKAATGSYTKKDVQIRCELHLKPPEIEYGDPNSIETDEDEN